MVGIELVVAGIVLLVAIALYVFHSRSESETEKTERTVEGTVEPTERFERVHATLTYPDGSEESIEYDDQVSTNTDGMTAFVTYDEYCFSIGRSRKHNNYPKVEKSVPTENKRYVNLGNVRDMDIDRTEELVAATEVEVDKEQEKRRSGNWRTTRYSYAHRNEEYDFDIWLGYEWDEK